MGYAIFAISLVICFFINISFIYVSNSDTALNQNTNPSSTLISSVRMSINIHGFALLNLLVFFALAGYGWISSLLHFVGSLLVGGIIATFAFDKDSPWIQRLNSFSKFATPCLCILMWVLTFSYK